MKKLALLLVVCTLGCFPPKSGGSAGGGGGSTGGGGGSSGPPAMSLPDGGTATWYRDVKAITQVRCEGCHTPGGIAPFAMDTYEHAKPFAGSMAADVTSGKMPPWMPSAGCGMEYVDDRRLAQDEIDVINAWAAGGAVEGDPKDAPAPVTGVGQLERVDQTVQSSGSYTPDSSLTDDYHCSLIDPALATSKDVIAYQVLPGVPAEVHHVILYAADRSAAQALDNNGQGWQCFGGSGINDAIMVGGWAPGSGAVNFPAGTGIQVAAGKVFVMQVHYNMANGVDTPDRTQVQLEYANAPVTEATLYPIGDYTFQVPPNAMNYSPGMVMTTNSLWTSLKVWGVFPHMHTHGRQIKVTGPSGCYIDIPNWDFHWQQQYLFTEPVALGAGQQVGIQCTWDNTTSAPLTWGEKTSDEMCLAFLYLTL